jgi:type I restriction enzyme, S subunit
VTRTVDLQPADLAILQQVLRDHLPPGVSVWAFGSRVTGRARRYSDLDLALQADAPLDLGVLAQLKDALSESDLTIKVDLVDVLTADPAFRELIEGDRVRLPLETAGD